MEANITVRNAKLSDAPRILEIYTYYVENTVITFEYDVPSLEEFENRMIDIMKKYPYLVIERDGRIKEISGWKFPLFRFIDKLKDRTILHRVVRSVY